MSSELTLLDKSVALLDGAKVIGSARLAVPEGSDIWSLAYWLCARAGNPHTRRAYRREALRWLAFLTDKRGANPPADNLLSSANYEDAGAFIDWLAGGGEPRIAEWAASMWNVDAGRPKTSEKVRQTAVVILHGMYEELGTAMVGEPPRPAIVRNPFKPYRRGYSKKSPEDTTNDNPDAPGVAKALSDAGWELLWEAACAPLETARNAHDLRIAARRRLALAMLRGTWERRAAAAGLTWADLQRSRDGTWKVRRERKGKGSIWEPVPHALFAEIQRFRAACGLPITPKDAEAGHSIYWLGGAVGRDGPISDDTFYRDIKALFKRAAQMAAAREDEDLEKELLRAGRGPHAIRHTMATQYMAAGGEARRAQDLLGHSSLAVTTRVYDTRTDQEKVQALEEQWNRSAGKDRFVR